MIARRTFLLGLGALIASPAIVQAKRFTGPISTAELRSDFPFRKIVDLMFGSMPSGEEFRAPGFLEDPTLFTLLRDDVQFFHVMLNPRAGMYRWVAAYGEEIELDKSSILRMTIEPAYHNTTLTMIYDVERDRTRRPRCFSESFHWLNGKLNNRGGGPLALNPADARI